MRTRGLYKSFTNRIMSSVKNPTLKNLAILIIALFASHLIQASEPPNSVCTSKTNYEYNEVVTWYFDLSGNSSITENQDLYFWSWTPNPIPGGQVLLDNHGDFKWSITFTPTELYGASVQEIEDLGNAAFWCTIRDQNELTVTGTISFSQKELLRNGSDCPENHLRTDIIQTIHLSGSATEAGSESQKMRPLYDTDSSFHQQYEIYTQLSKNGYFNLKNTTDNTTITIGGENNVFIPGDTTISVASNGWKRVVVDLNNDTYQIETVYGWNVISNMLPKTAAQQSWWGGVASLVNYDGHGVWSAEINFSEKTAAADVSRFYITRAGTSFTLKQIKRTKNQLIAQSWADDANITHHGIYHFNGIYELTLDMNTYTYDLFKSCEEQDTNRIVFLGSSVCKGYGAQPAIDAPSLYQGYAYQYTKQLEDRHLNQGGNDWNTVNVSIGGNNTQDVLNRLDKHLYPNCGKYVVIGLSMANEGLLSGGQKTFDQFETNMLAIIDTLKNHDLVPIIMSNYANASYGPIEYQFIKDMNLLIHQWDVASTNLLGAHENGQGKFLSDYISDPWHPNTIGYTEFKNAMVPSLFDAIANGKPQPQKQNTGFTSIDKQDTNYQISFTPEGEVHSFTFTFDFKTTQSGVLASWLVDGNLNTIGINSNGQLGYVSNSGQIEDIEISNDNLWHNVSITHYYANETTLMYLDGELIGELNEQLVPTQFFINGEYGPTASYRELFFHRSGMNQDEITSLHQGGMLKSSLEIYAPLDSESQQLQNNAQSLNSLSAQIFAVNHTFIEAEDYAVAQSPVTNTTNAGDVYITDYNAGEWMVWYTTLPITGDYIVQYHVASNVDGGIIRLEQAGGNPIFGLIDIPNTGGLQTWSTIEHQVSLSQGPQHIAIYSPNGGFNIDWLRLIPVNNTITAKYENSAHSIINQVLYPIPAQNWININTDYTDTLYEVIDLTGQLLKKGMGNQINTTELKNGTYITRLNINGEQTIHKISIQK